MERRPCQNRNSEGCPVYQATGHCFEDVHHLYYPRRSYQSGVSRDFRELDENKIIMCRAEHNEKHATERPPLKPGLDFMKNAINRARQARRTYHERKTA